MADLRLTTSRVGSRWGELPLALRIALVYAAARVVSLGFFAIAATISSGYEGGAVTIGDLAMKWDAQWFRRIAVEGYPTVLPEDVAGRVEQNAWAFLPLYPVLAQLVGTPLGGWGVGAVLVSLAAGYVCCLLLHALLRPRLDATAAMWAVVLFAAGPLAALFQVGYAESLGLVWVLLALVLVTRRRWGWLWLVIPLLGATRPGVLALALLLGLYGLWRLRIRRRDPLPFREGLQIGLLAVWAAIVGFSWSVIAGVATGRADAYLATELAWRRVWLGPVEPHFVPFDGFVQGVVFWAGQWRMDAGLLGALAVVLVVAVGAALVWEPHVRRLGVVVRLWSASYLLYLLAVFFPQSSIFRLLYPLTPLVGAFAAPPRTVWRVGMLAVSLALQATWILVMWGLGLTFFQVP